MLTNIETEKITFKDYKIDLVSVVANFGLRARVEGSLAFYPNLVKK